MVVDHPQGPLSPPSHISSAGFHVHIHLRSPRLYLHSLDRLVLTPWGRARLATDEDAWELTRAAVLIDPEGTLERTRTRAVELLSRRGMGRARVAGTLARLAPVERRTAALARVTKGPDRSRLALSFARGLFALGPRDEYSGLIGLTLRLASQMAGGQVLTWYLREEAARGVALALPQLDLRAALSEAMGTCGLTEDETADLTARTIAAAHAEAERSLPVSPQVLINLERYERMARCGKAVEALLLLRGDAARWLGRHPAYLALCGVVAPGEQTELAAAWPHLLAVLSTWFAALQMLSKCAATADLPLGPPA